MTVIKWARKRFQRLPIIRLSRKDKGQDEQKKKQKEKSMNINKGLASLGICGVVIAALIVTGEPNVLWGLAALVIVW